MTAPVLAHRELNRSCVYCRIAYARLATAPPSSFLVSVVEVHSAMVAAGHTRKRPASFSDPIGQRVERHRPPSAARWTEHAARVQLPISDKTERAALYSSHRRPDLNTQTAPRPTQRAREILKGARALITDPAHFCQNKLAESSDGYAVNPRAPGACRWCAWGAIAKIGWTEPDASRARELLTWECMKRFGTRVVESVNDGEDGHARILEAFALAVSAP